MRTLILVAMVCGALVSSRAAIGEGGTREVGNGGNAIVCNTTNVAGEKTSYAYVLDLYEARELYDLELLPNASGTSEIEFAKSIVEKLKAIDAGYALRVVEELDDVIKKSHLLAPGQGLTPIPDSFHVTYPKFCDIKQLANYTKNHGILIDQDIWNLLDTTNRAALFMHEAVYKVERDLFGATDSIIARKIVAYLFSKTELTVDLWKSQIRPEALLQFEYDNHARRFGPTSDNSPHKFTIMNAGSGTTSKISIVIEGTSPTKWALTSDNCSGRMLEPGQTCSLTVTFLAGQQHQTAGSYSAVLQASAGVGGATSLPLSGIVKFTWMGGGSFYSSSEKFDGVDPQVLGSSCINKGRSYYQKIADVAAGVQYLYRRDSRGDSLCPGQWYYQPPSFELHRQMHGWLRECNTEGPMWPTGSNASQPGRVDDRTYLCAPKGSADIVWASGIGALGGAIPGSCNHDRYVVRHYFCW